MSATPGRPLSAELSEQLISVAVDILAEEGWGRLNSDRVAARAHAGKAGIYRRWRTMGALARHALDGFSLVQVPDDHGSLRDDLVALASRWTRPLDREERALSSIVGAARHDELLREGVDAAFVAPLAEAVSAISERAQQRGEPIAPDRVGLLGAVLEALWWQRYTAAGDGAVLAEQVERVVDEVLVPIVLPVREAARL
jgi:AcrR family transcriptional regulator